MRQYPRSDLGAEQQWPDLLQDKSERVEQKVTLKQETRVKSWHFYSLLFL